MLLKHSADVNARDKNWQTPLHIAAANKAVRCAEALVPLLSNVNVSDRAGRTALHHAAFSGHLEVMLSLKYCLSALMPLVLIYLYPNPFDYQLLKHTNDHKGAVLTLWLYSLSCLCCVLKLQPLQYW